MKKILVMLLMVLTAACSSPKPNFFQPVSLRSAEMVYPEFKGTVLLGQIIMPPEAARPQITTLGAADFELKIDEFNRWGAAPEKLIQRVLNQNLSLLLPQAMIENQTLLRKNFNYAVAVELLEMSGRLDETATLTASYFIKNKMNRVIKQGKFSQTLAIDGSYDEYVPAQSKLLGLLAAQIAKDFSALK